MGDLKEQLDSTISDMDETIDCYWIAYRDELLLKSLTSHADAQLTLNNSITLSLGVAFSEPQKEG